MCSARSKLSEKHAAAVSAYKEAISRMKEVRGNEFERAWRLTENRRLSLECARKALADHEQEHYCAA